MLLVKTRIGPSKIHGIGLFAADFIAKGTQIWKFMDGFDLRVNNSDLKKLPDVARRQFLNYAYKNSQTGDYILCFDDARFMNNSQNANTSDTNGIDDIGGEGVTVAKVDIKKGEEITCRYSDFDGDYDVKLKMGGNS